MTPEKNAKVLPAFEIHCESGKQITIFTSGEVEGLEEPFSVINRIHPRLDRLIGKAAQQHHTSQDALQRQNVRLEQDLTFARKVIMDIAPQLPTVNVELTDAEYEQIEQRAKLDDSDPRVLFAGAVP